MLLLHHINGNTTCTFFIHQKFTLSLTLGRFGYKLKYRIFKRISKIYVLDISYQTIRNATEPNWWYVNTGSGNVLRPRSLLLHGVTKPRWVEYALGWWSDGLTHVDIQCNKLDSGWQQTYKTSKDVITFMPGDSYIYSSVKHTLYFTVVVVTDMLCLCVLGHSILYIYYIYIFIYIYIYAT